MSREREEDPVSGLAQPGRRTIPASVVTGGEDFTSGTGRQSIHHVDVHVPAQETNGPIPKQPERPPGWNP
jgi:hypothetical protein